MTPRSAVFAAFLAFGTGFGLWSGAIAAVAGRAGVTPQMLGFAVTGYIAAALTGMAAGGRLSRGFALKTILLSAMAGSAASLALLLQADRPSAFIAGVIAFGVANGIFDGAMNAEGTTVEAAAGRPILSGFHAAASFATGAAAILGSLLAVRFGTVAVAALALVGYAAGAALVAAAMPRRALAAPGQERVGQPRRRRPIVLLGLVVGICIAGETAAAMFSAPALVVQAPDLASYAGFGATAFALCQGLMRSLADRLRVKVGDLRLIELSVLGAAVGFAVVAASGSFAQTALGFALVGAGTACLVPCGFSLAPSYAGIAAAEALGLIALVSAVPRIPAPLAFGDVAARFSFSVAFALNAALFVAALALMALLRRTGPLRMGLQSDGAGATATPRRRFKARRSMPASAPPSASTSAK